MANKLQKNKSLSFLQAIKSLSRDSLSPIYFIYGEERYLQDELIQKILELAVDATTREFNLDIFYANEIDVEKAINISRSYPLMADKRVVVIKDIHFFKANAIKQLDNYLANPSHSTCLILTYPKKNITGKGIQGLAKNATAIDCRELYEEETLAWINNYVRSKNMEIDVQAVYLIYQVVGNSLLNIVNEIEKIQINIHPRNKITVEDVQTISSITKQNTVFELCDAVVEKNFSKSISILNNLIKRGEKPTTIVIQLTKHLVNYLKIKESLRLRKYSMEELRSVTRLNPFFINKIKKHVNNYSVEQIRRAFSHLATADLHLKTSYQSPRLILELLLYRIIKHQR